MSARVCPGCGKEIPAEAGDGLCPACVLRAAIEDDPGEEEPAEQDDGALRFGPYTTLRVLGEGGMGVVYLAEQEEPIRRVVALKVLKAGLEFGQADLRFEAERQALALMNHPAIARV
jgi:serine/threonine protein kinase